MEGASGTLCGSCHYKVAHRVDCRRRRIACLSHLGAFANIKDSDLTPRFDWSTNTASSHQGLMYALIVFAVLVTLTTPRQPSN